MLGEQGGEQARQCSFQRANLQACPFGIVEGSQ